MLKMHSLRGGMSSTIKSLANKWFAENPDIELVDIQYISESGDFHAFIVYKERQFL
jgi:hypothetical protein